MLHWDTSELVSPKDVATRIARRGEGAAILLRLLRMAPRRFSTRFFAVVMEPIGT
jgi:hypothetical protein